MEHRLICEEAQLFFSRGRLLGNNARLFHSRGWLLGVQAKRTTRECQAGSKSTRRTRFKTTPLFCLSYTDVFTKQRRCFKEVPAKQQRGGTKRVLCRRQFKRDIFCCLVRKNFFPHWGASFYSRRNKIIVLSEKHLTLTL